MEADHTTQDDPPEGNNIENHEKTPRKQLQMAVSVQLPVMQDVYEHGQRKIVQSHERNKVQTARKSFKKPPLKGPQNLQGTSISGKILRFSCSECKGNTTFSPNDLSKHFQGVHQGSLPTFPCDLCGYITQDFSNLQRHRLGHRDTFVRCEVCNDSVQYTLLQLTRHFSMYHSLNGLYRCERCNFSTKDVGTIVQHIHRHNEIQYKCPKCKHVSYTSGEFQKHLLVHSGKFTCQFCDYRAPRKDYIIRHMNSAHSKEKKNKWRVKGENSKTLMNSSPGLKLLLTKNPARETWMSKRLHALSGGGLLEEYGKLSNPEKTLEETKQFLERTVASEKESKKWIKALKTEQQFVSQAIPSLSQSKLESPVTPNAGFMNPSSNGLTVLMVKNKISIPPNCTTKVMGFKMVDGKKHLVLKVIPSGKQEVTPKTGLSSSAVKEMDRHTSETLLTEENSSDCAVYGVEQTSSILNSSNLDSSKSTALVGLDPLVRRNSENSCVVQKNGDEQPSKPVQTEESRIFTFSEAKNNNDQFPLLEASAPVAKIGPAKVKSLLKSSMEEASEIKGATSFTAFANALKPTVTQQEQRCIALEEMHSPTDCEENITIDNESNSGLNSSSEKVFSFHNYSKDTSSFSSDVSLPIEDQSYSELLTDGPEPNSSKIVSLADSNRTPDDSSMASGQDCHNNEIPEQLLLNSDPLMEKVPDSEIEVDECIATVEEESNGLNNFPGLACRLDATVKSTSQREGKQSFLLGNSTDNEERETNIDDFGSATEHQNHAPEKGLDGSCIQKVPGSSCNAAALGRILEEHSDAIISQQLEKERIGTAVTNGVFRQATTTLRILQPFNVKDGKQQVFLQTAENNSAVPVELQSSPGFKMISGSSVPPINVSCLKPGTERPGKTTAALAFTLNNGRIGKTARVMGGKEAGYGLLKDGEENPALNCVKEGSSNNTSHLLVDSSPLKGPLILSSATPSLSRERTVNAPTCFLVQRPLPVVAAVARPNGEAVNQGLQNQAMRPMLAVPVNSQDQATILQAGRQAFILRYVSPAKTGIPLNSPEGKPTSQIHPNDSGGNRVFLKIVKNLSDGAHPLGSGELNSSLAAHAAANQPIYLATGALQSPYVLLSSNQSNVTVSTGIKTSGSSQAPMHAPITVSQLQKFSSATIQGKTGEKSANEGLNNKLKRVRLPQPRSNHQLAKRKKKRKSQSQDPSEPLAKSKRHSSKKNKEKDAFPDAVNWKPVPKDVERTLRLSPFCPSQLIKCPRRNQPVIVLNHPDVDIPEVTNIMRTVSRYKGEVLKVALSQRTVDALSELSCNPFKRSHSVPDNSSHGQHSRRENTARERFILKLKLKKTSRNKYQVVNTTSDSTERSSSFSCWFCGRIFDNQEEWIGHGQRHLMEATRDWNKLF